jgi:hypothetical protein
MPLYTSNHVSPKGYGKASFASFSGGPDSLLSGSRSDKRHSQRLLLLSQPG